MRIVPVVLLGLLSILGGCAGGVRPSASAESVLARAGTGYIEVEGGKVWYEVTGTGHGTPLLVLHGGPGIPHDYLSNLDMFGEDRPVVFYDQLGCGRSERPDDPSLWTRERFCRELQQVRDALGLDEVVLYGHSWGSILAVDYLSGKGGSAPSGVKGLILAGPALSIPRWVADSRLMIAALPAADAEAIREGERTGQTESEGYQKALGLYYAQHVCRLDPWPAPVNRALETMGEQVYFTMNGPSEFTITGPLKDVDVTGELGGLGARVLYVCGEYDEATPGTTRWYAGLTPGSEVAVIRDASHLANFEQPGTYKRVVGSWLRRQGL